MGRARITAVAVAAAIGLALGGCGGGGSTLPPGTNSATTPPYTPPPPPPPTPPPAPAGADRVVRRWADTLRGGDVAGAARLFALPAVVQIIPTEPAQRLTTRAQVREFNRSLPCGALVVRTERRGAYAEGLFRLVERPGATCDGPGGTARAAFKVRDGRIVEWRRRLDREGDELVTAPVVLPPRSAVA